MDPVEAFESLQSLVKRQSGRRACAACLAIGGGKRRGPANTSDARRKDLMARPREEGILTLLTSEKTVRI